MAAMSTAAASSSAIDLSRLPAPTIVVQLTFEQILAELIDSLRLLLPDFDATVDSDPIVKLLQVFAYRELLLRQNGDDSGRQVMVAYATGANLDQLGALVGVRRLTVTAADPLTGADAVLETDEALRRRIVLAPEAFSVAGPETAYVSLALGADATISDASAYSPVPGRVVVSILAAGGNGTTSADQIARVHAAVTAPDKRPLTDLVEVVSATIVPFAVVGRIHVFRGPDATVVLAQAQARVADVVAQARRLGRDVPRSVLIAAMHVEGVQRVDLDQPAADVVVDPTQATNCVGTDIRIAGYGD